MKLDLRSNWQKRLDGINLNPPEPPGWNPFDPDDEWEKLKDEYRLQLEAYKAKGEFIEKLSKARESKIDWARVISTTAIIGISTVQLVMVLRFESSGVIATKAFSKILKIPLA